MQYKLSKQHFEQMQKRSFHHHGQNGSIMVIVLMLLVIMSLIGIASINTSVTENFIVRNAAIRKQNVLMADSVAGEVLQQILDAGIVDADVDDPPLLTEAQINPQGAPLPWVHGHDTLLTDAGFTYADWYSQTLGPLLDAGNSDTPWAITKDDGTGISEILKQRGELATSPPRYALIGWVPVTGGSLKMTTAIRGAGRVLVEYMSDDFGVVRLTVGVERWFL